MIGQGAVGPVCSPPLTKRPEDASLLKAHQHTRASYLLNADAAPGWHVGYFAVKGLCQHNLDLRDCSDQELLRWIKHRPEERQEVLRGVQAYRQEFQHQLKKVLSKSEMPQG